MQRFNQGYSNLFGLDDLEDKRQDAEEGDEEPNQGGQTNDGFVDRWCWIYHIDQVAEVRRQSWDEIFSLNVVEFLNMLCYIRDKRNWEKKQREEWRRTH